MDFGSVPSSEISKIDFTLPKNSAFTNEVLKSAKPAKAPKIYVGCAKWGRKEWVGKIYPEKTKEANFLQEYVKHFNGIELNATHYRMPTAAQIKGWREKTKELDFKFSPKIVQSISHFSTLVSPNVEPQTTEFISAVSEFGNNLGPIFLQLSDKFSPARKENLFSYLKTLPKDLTFFLEVRHADWFADKNIRKELLETLKENNAGLVITDTPGRRDLVHMELSIPKAFIRFVGNNLDPTDYTRVDAWAVRLKDWIKKGLQELYFYMHQTDERYSPELCEYAIEQINKQCGTNIPKPTFIKRDERDEKNRPK